jgi:hypothetical protein
MAIVRQAHDSNLVSVMNLKQLADIKMGYAFRSRLEHDPHGTVAVIQMKDIDDENVVHGEVATRVTLPTGTGHHRLRAGDLLFRSRGRTNSVALVPDGLDDAVLAAPMLRIRPRAVRPDYLYWYLNAPATQAQLAALSEGTSVRMISAETLKMLDVPVPDGSVQQRIAQLASLAEREHRLHLAVASRRERLAQHLLMTFAHEAAR